MPDQEIVFAWRDGELRVSYRTLRDGRVLFSDGRHARIHSWDEEGLDAEIDGRRHHARISRAEARLVVQGTRGDVEFEICPRFKLPGAEEAAGGFVAKMPGKVIDLRVEAGQRVSAGETLVVLEAMKMEHPMSASEDGVVTEVRVEVGEQVESGTLLLVFEPEE
jgi:propionyl-CoA carboxylase alpha chain